MTPETMDWWPTAADPADCLVSQLKTVDWRGLRDGEPLHPHLAYRLRECALWMVAGRTDNPLAYGVGEDLEGLLLLDVGRAVLLWLTDPTDAGLIDAMLLAVRSCAVFGDLLPGDE